MTDARWLKSKRGFLLGEETIKIIIAVIAIAFLVFLLVSLYNNFSKNRDLGYAKDSLDHLVSVLNAGGAQVEIYNPKGWKISSFPSTSTGGIGAGTLMPKECSSVGWKNCLCIWKKTTSFSQESSGLAEITFGDQGTCMESDFSVIGTQQGGQQYTGTQQGTVAIDNPPVLLSIDQKAKTITEAK